MHRLLPAVFLSAVLALALAVPAFGGETIDGDGYALRLPAGFTEALSIENSGNLRIKSRFGNLPVEGMPEIKAFVAGSAMAPDGMIMVARVNLSRSITTAEELGLSQIEEMKEQLPEGVDIRSAKIAGHNAIEMILHQDGYNGRRTARVASIAAGDYVIVVMLETSDELYADSTAMWSTLLASMKIEPGMNKILLFGLVGVAGLVGLWFLGRIRSRPTHEIPAYTGRFKRDDGIDTGPGFPPRPAPETRLRPKVLSSRPGAEAEMSGAGSARMGMGGSRPSPEVGSAHGRVPTSPAVTRPEPAPANERAGLRRTRPETGRWGD